MQNFVNEIHTKTELEEVSTRGISEWYVLRTENSSD